MYAYKVEEPYHPNRTWWPELAQYNFRGGEHELVLFFESPTTEEILAVRKAPASIALYVERSLIVFLFKFGHQIPWSDAPFSIHLVPKAERVPAPETGPSEQALLHIILVDASTGIIRAMRALTIPPDFTQALHRAINEQANMPFRRDLYNGELEALFAGYSSETLAEMSQLHFESRP